MATITKMTTKYAQLRDVESVRAIARAHQARNLADFEKALRYYGMVRPPSFSIYHTRDEAINTMPRFSELSSNPTIRSHLAALFDTLLEHNLLRIVEPYSMVKVEYVAQQVRQNVEAK